MPKAVMRYRGLGFFFSSPERSRTDSMAYKRDAMTLYSLIFLACLRTHWFKTEWESNMQNRNGNGTLGLVSAHWAFGQ